MSNPLQNPSPSIPCPPPQNPGDHPPLPLDPSTPPALTPHIHRPSIPNGSSTNPRILLKNSHTIFPNQRHQSSFLSNPRSKPFPPLSQPSSSSHPPTHPLHPPLGFLAQAPTWPSSPLNPDPNGDRATPSTSNPLPSLHAHQKPSSKRSSSTLDSFVKHPSFPIRGRQPPEQRTYAQIARSSRKPGFV